MLRNPFGGCVKQQIDLAQNKAPTIVLCVGMIVGSLLPLAHNRGAADAAISDVDPISCVHNTDTHDISPDRQPLK